MMMVGDMMVGDRAPAGAFETVDGEMRTLDEYRAGRPLVLYFYPKDDTPGCTTEARDFSEHAARFAELGIAVLGVSKDSGARHRKFTAKHGLTVELGTDSTDLCAVFGVWGERSMYGKTYMGIERATFLIAADKRIASIWRKVKVAGHVESVIEAARSLVR